MSANFGGFKGKIQTSEHPCRVDVVVLLSIGVVCYRVQVSQAGQGGPALLALGDPQGHKGHPVLPDLLDFQATLERLGPRDRRVSREVLEHLEPMACKVGLVCHRKLVLYDN